MGKSKVCQPAALFFRLSARPRITSTKRPPFSTLINGLRIAAFLTPHDRKLPRSQCEKVVLTEDNLGKGRVYLSSSCYSHTSTHTVIISGGEMAVSNLNCLVTLEILLNIPSSHLGGLYPGKHEQPTGSRKQKVRPAQESLLVVDNQGSNEVEHPR